MEIRRNKVGVLRVELDSPVWESDRTKANLLRMKTEFPGDERHLKFYFSIVNILATEKSRRPDFFEMSFERENPTIIFNFFDGEIFKGDIDAFDIDAF